MAVGREEPIPSRSRLVIFLCLVSFLSVHKIWLYFILGLVSETERCALDRSLLELSPSLDSCINTRRVNGRTYIREPALLKPDRLVQGSWWSWACLFDVNRSFAPE